MPKIFIAVKQTYDPETNENYIQEILGLYLVKPREEVIDDFYYITIHEVELPDWLRIHEPIPSLNNKP